MSIRGTAPDANDLHDTEQFSGGAIELTIIHANQHHIIHANQLEIFTIAIEERILRLIRLLLGDRKSVA